MAEPRVVLSELTGPIVLDGQLAVFDGVRGLANGGALALDGSLAVRGHGAERRRAQYPGAGRGARDAARPAQRARCARDLPARSAEPIAHRRHPHRAERLHRNHHDRRAGAPGGAAGHAVERRSVRIWIACSSISPITTTDDIIVDNNYGRLAAGANVRLIGTVAEPGMDGRITLREGGQIFLAGRTFRITRGDISFTDRRHIHPEFNIAAEADLGEQRQRDDDADRHAGAADDRSDAPKKGSMTPGEIAAEIVGSTNTETALTLLSADLLGVTGRAIGLDAFRARARRLHRSRFPRLPGRSDADRQQQHRPDDAPDRRQAAERSGRIHGVAEPARERQGHVRRQLLPAPQHRAARALARQRHGQPRRPPPGDVRRRREPAAVGAARPAGDQRDHVRRRRCRRSRRRREPRSSSRTATSSISSSCSSDIDRIREAFHEQGFLEARVRTRRVEVGRCEERGRRVPRRSRSAHHSARSTASWRRRTWSTSSKRRGTRTCSISS